MLRIGVLGGGPAGVAAAREAAEAGARVVLFEETPKPTPPKADWLRLLDSPNLVGDDSLRALSEGGVDVRLGEPALSVDSACTVATPKSRTRLDAVVIATGSRFSSRVFPGSGKPGVFLLDDWGAYSALGNQLQAGWKVIVLGRGITALQIADRLNRAGNEVTLLKSGGAICQHLELGVCSILELAAIQRGVSIVKARVQRAVGLGAVEGVVVDGRVLSCDALLALPERVPNVPAVAAKLGPGRGVVVDPNLRSSVARLFAAGDCAEYAVGGRTCGIMLASTARSSGRVAGANATGHSLFFDPVGSFSAELFGLRVASAGLGLEAAKLAGFDTALISKQWVQGSGCWIVYERLTSRILGIQLVRQSAGQKSDSAPLVVPHSILLEALAYEENDGSTDITLVAETAREGLKRRELGDAPGSDLRPSGG